MKKITIIYSSGGGNTRLVVDKIKEQLEAAGWQSDLINAILAEPADLTRTPVMLLAAPTYDHGVLHKPYEKFLDHAEASAVDLSGHTYAIVGLGDAKYDAEYNIESAHLLSEFVTTHQGDLLDEPLKINKSPVDQLNDQVTNRTSTLLDKLTNDETED